MKVVLINGIELRTESDAEIEALLRWLSTEATFEVPSTHSGLRALAPPMTDDVVDDGEKGPGT